MVINNPYRWWLLGFSERVHVNEACPALYGTQKVMNVAETVVG